MVSLAQDPRYPRVEELKFKTPSGKIEILAAKLEGQGLSSLQPYESPAALQDGSFRLTFGRCAVHTQGHTVNNPILCEEMPENVLWLNSDMAREMRIEDGSRVEVANHDRSGIMKVKVTDLIHPDAVFMVHGFGHLLPVESRGLGKGVADHLFMPGGLDVCDPAGGGLALQEHFVTVRKVS
jgi:thiosulfate reductase/polysulfide reductase chain A